MGRILSAREASKAELLPIELDGTPESIAAHHLEVGRRSETRPIGPPRASSLYSSCIRFHGIGYKCKYPEYQSLNAAMRIVYAIGNGVHLWIQNSDDVIVSPKVGWWECLACGHTFWSTGYPDIDCPKCGARKRALRYKEHSLSLSAPYQSTGHPDLFIQVGNYVRVVEIKTIAGDAFGKLYAPFIEHQWQLQYYMWGCSEDTKLPVQVDPYVGYCVYVSKVPNWKSIPYKMFVVEKNTNVLQSVKRKLLEFNDILSDAGFGRMHNECVADFECSRAKWCSVRKYCTEFREAGL